MRNFQNIKLRSNSARPVLDYKSKNSNERFVGANNQINAGSKTELMAKLVELAHMVQAGEVDASPRGNQNRTSEVNSSAKRAQVLEAAYYSDASSRDWANLGAAISADLTESADRDGIMRRLLTRVEVAQGTLPRIRVKQKQTLAIIAASAMENRPTYLRDKFLIPPEWYIKANFRVEERELAQGSGDILEDKFFEAQEHIMVNEDRRMKQLLDATIGVNNDLQILAGGLSPSTLSQMRVQILRWNLPAQTLLFASDVLDDLIGQGANTFGNYFDPVSQFEIVQTGMLGTLMGMQIMTDAYRNPVLKVLNQGDIYVLSTAEMLGAYTDRGPVQSQEVNSYPDGAPARGFNFFELMAMVIHNARAVVVGSRSA